jgi:hypothetical protein
MRRGYIPFPWQTIAGLAFYAIAVAIAVILSIMGVH